MESKTIYKRVGPAQHEKEGLPIQKAGEVSC